DPLRAVVDLVEPSPEEVTLVTPAVPPVVEEWDGQITENGAGVDAQRIGVPRAVQQHPAIPSGAGNPDGSYLYSVEQTRQRPTSARVRPVTGGTASLHHHHDQRHAQDDCGYCQLFKKFEKIHGKSLLARSVRDQALLSSSASKP